MSNRDDQIAGLLSESVLTNKLLQRVIYAFQTENLQDVESIILSEDEIGEMIRFFKSAQEHLNHIIDQVTYIRMWTGYPPGYTERVLEKLSPNEFKNLMVGIFNGEAKEK